MALHPAMAEAVRRFVVWAGTRGFRVRLTSGFRSRREQQRLWDARATNPNPVAPPGSSAHEAGLAQDIDELNGKLTALGELAREGGFTVIVEKTVVHLEWPNWRAAVRR